MADPDTEIGGQDRALPTTSYTVLASLKGKDGAAREAERLVQLYWKPVYCLVRRSWANSNEDAKDATQDFFTEVVLGDGFARGYEPKQGSFRSYLKGALRNFLAKRTRDGSREKRGGGNRPLSLDLPDTDLEAILPDAHALAPEEAFDRAWRDVVVARAAALVEERLGLEGKRVYFEVFRRYDLDPEDGVSYESLAKSLRLSTDDVKNYLTRCREEFRSSVRAVLCESVGSAEILAQEWEALFGGL
jgi:RNA polymerase sigma factor (sigma-70 family)